MARVRGPALSLAASGNLGAINYTSWRGLQIARAAENYTFTPSESQKVINDYLIAVCARWGGTLTSSQRAVWEAVARGQTWVGRLGLAMKPSGYNLFVKVNMIAKTMGGVYQNVPPDLGKNAMMAAFVATTGGLIGEIDIDVTIHSASATPDRIQIFRAGPYDSPGRHALEGEFLLIANQVTPFDLTDTGLTSTKYYWYKGRVGWLTGTVGNFFETQAQAA